MIDARNSDALTLWKQTAYLTIVALAFTMDEFTSDDLWARFDDLPQHPEPRALGSVVVSAKAAGIIKETGAYKKSQRVACHNRPIAIYKSLVREAVRNGNDVTDNVIPFRRESAGSLLSAG